MPNLKKLTFKGTVRQVFIWLRHPPIDFCLGWCINFVGSESGQVQRVKFLQNMVSNTTQHHPTPYQPHTVCVTVAYFCTARQERPGRDGCITKKDEEDHGEESASITMQVLPPLWFQGAEHTRLRERGWGEPIRTKGRLSDTLVIV